jgi:signal transduction histidine kinase
VLADQRKLKQMLYNYLSNAIKFTPEQGHITISAQPISRASVLALFQGSPGFSDGNLVKTTVFVQVCVADSGQGIAAVDQQRLFGHYEQVQQSQRDKGVTKAVAGLGGTGLGLMMVKTLATAHGGAVAVVSAPGAGSRFYFFLPLHTIVSAGGVAAVTPSSGEATP